MALIINHPFVSGIADDPVAVAAGEVVPSNWNAAHSVGGTLDYGDVLFAPAYSITPGGEVTLNARCGRVILGAGNTTLLVNNTFVSDDSLVFLIQANLDIPVQLCVRSAQGYFQIHADPDAIFANMYINFLVVG